MERSRPDERFAEVSRILVDVHHQQKREPRRTAVLRAALLDVMLEALQAWSRREPALASAISGIWSTHAEMRQEIGGEETFEAEVDAVRSVLTSHTGR